MALFVAMAAKRRKLSEAKLSHLTSKLEEQESYREERVLQERCIALLKGKSARQLRAILAFYIKTRGEGA